MGVTILFA